MVCQDGRNEVLVSQKKRPAFERLLLADYGSNDIFFISIKKNYNYYKNTATLTVTLMARKDTRSPGPHHECHLHFNYKLIQREQKLSRTKRRGCCCYISTLI